MEQGRQWAAQITAGIGRRVADLRAERKVTAEQLAERCAALKFPALSRIVITKLENGRRESLTVAELLVLAAALEVPPILLMLPLGQQEEMEILPAYKVNTWHAADWWDGRSVIKDLPEHGWMLGPNLDEDILMLSWSYQHAIWKLRLVGGNIDAVTAGIGELLGDDSEAAALLRKQINQDVQNSLKAIAEVRREMRNEGIIPPPLPQGLTFIDGLASPESADPDGAR